MSSNEKGLNRCQSLQEEEIQAKSRGGVVSVLAGQCAHQPPNPRTRLLVLVRLWVSNVSIASASQNCKNKVPLLTVVAKTALKPTRIHSFFAWAAAPTNTTTPEENQLCNGSSSLPKHASGLETTDDDDKSDLEDWRFQ